MKQTWFKSDAVFAMQFEKIDRKSGILYGVKMVSEGEAKGHGVYLNSEFINKTVSLAKDHKNGVRARFGHPNMCNDSLGTYLGVYKNVRKKGNSAIGDLFLSDVAKDTPNGNLYDYVFNLAEKDPGAFGSSIVFEGSEPVSGQLDDGTEVMLAQIDKLEFTDLVGQPAATDGLFSAETLADVVTEFLDENPRIYELVEKKPEIFNVFLNKYKMFKLGKSQKEVKKLNSVTLTDGKILVYADDELKVGTELTPVGFDALENGEYQTNDGVKFLCNDGSVSEIKKKEEESSEAGDAALSAITETLTELASAVTGIQDQLTALQTEFKELKEKGSTAKPPKGKVEQAASNKTESFDVLGNVRKAAEKIREEIVNARKA
jgi:hypothetical protein